MEIISYTIKDVKDDEGYLDSLGKKRTAEVKRDARIGEAEATRDASIKVLKQQFSSLEIKRSNPFNLLLTLGSRGS